MPVLRVLRHGRLEDDLDTVGDAGLEGTRARQILRQHPNERKMHSYRTGYSSSAPRDGRECSRGDAHPHGFVDPAAHTQQLHPRQPHRGGEAAVIMLVVGALVFAPAGFLARRARRTVWPDDAKASGAPRPAAAHRLGGNLRLWSELAPGTLVRDGLVTECHRLGVGAVGHSAARLRFRGGGGDVQGEFAEVVGSRFHGRRPARGRWRNL